MLDSVILKKKVERNQKSEELRMEDFLIQSDYSILEEFTLKPRNLDGFQFIDYSDLETDVFKDSKEELNEAETELEKLFTPFSWKSKSAANIAQELINENSLPRSRIKSEAIKRPGTPTMNEQRKKKTREKVLILVKH